MKFDPYAGVDFQKQIVLAKALQRLSSCIYWRRKLPAGEHSVEVLRAASVLQYAPDSTVFVYLGKHTIERILGKYVAESTMLEAAQALGMKVKDRKIQTSRAFVTALNVLERTGQVVEFPAAEQEKARAV